MGALPGCLGDPTGIATVFAKVPENVLQTLSDGRTSDVLVLLDESLLAAEMPALGAQLAATSVPDDQVTARAALYSQGKRAIFDSVPPGGITTRVTFDHLPILFVTVRDMDALLPLVQRPEVVLVAEDGTHHHDDDLALIHAPDVKAEGHDGAGTTVAVLDTGVDWKRAAFGPCTAPGVPASCKVAYAADVALNDRSLDDTGHGTNVSGIVLSVAPGARIIGLDVFNGDYAFSSDILAAVDWVIGHRAAYNIVAINLSLGGATSTTLCPTDVLAVAIRSARRAGILAASASGNDGNPRAIASPACAPDAISVGAVYDANQGGWQYGSCTDATTAADQVTCFSNSAPFLTLLAPGAQITAAGSTMSGTSQATPHVAGAIAVLRATFPGDTPDATLARLTSGGKPVKDPRTGQVTPRLDLLGAVQAKGGADLAPPSGSVALSGGTVYTTIPSVTLALSAADPSGVTQMCVSNAATCANWLPFGALLPWTLLPGDGVRPVNAWFRDGAGNANATPFTAAITLDATAPTDGTVSAAPGGGQVLLRWDGFADATSGIARYKVMAGTQMPTSCAGAQEVYSGADKTFTHVGLANGTTYFYRVCAVDKAGNVSPGATATARPQPEFTPPTGTLVINAGAPFTNTVAVTLTLAATDASGVARMCISNNMTCAAWAPYATSLPWNVPAGEGPHPVYAWFRDTWGNTVVTPATSSIALDTTAPVNGAATTLPGKRQASLAWGGFSDAGSGIAAYRVVSTAAGSAPANCAVATALYNGPATSFVHTGLTPGTVYFYRVCAVDKVGNWSTGATTKVTPTGP